MVFVIFIFSGYKLCESSLYIVKGMFNPIGSNENKLQL